MTSGRVTNWGWYRVQIRYFVSKWRLLGQGMTLHEVNHTPSMILNFMTQKHTQDMNSGIHQMQICGYVKQCIRMKLLQIKQHLSTPKWSLSSFQNGRLHLPKATAYRQEVFWRPLAFRLLLGAHNLALWLALSTAVRTYTRPLSKLVGTVPQSR